MKKKIFFVSILIIPFFIFSQGSGSNIILNGSNQYVTIPYSPELNPTTELTIEAWFKPTQNFTGVGTDPIFMKSFTSHTYPYYQYGLYMRASTEKEFRFLLHADNGNDYNIGTSGNFYTIGNWYHLCGTYDGEFMHFYVNGEKIDSTPVSGNISAYNTGVEIGKLRNFNGYTPGEYDELRIWNKAFTQAEIRSNMTKTITNVHPNYSNLVAYYNVNTNSGSTLFDQTSNGNNGTLVNSPTWQTSSAPIGDDTTYITSVSNGSVINLAHTDGSDLTVNVTGGAAESLYIYNVQEKPNITTPPIGLDQVSHNNYFGVKAFGSSSLTYEVVYNYDGHSGILNESNLRLCTRSDNSAINWTLQSATLNIASNTLTLGGQTGTEFILGSIGGNTITVEEFEFNKLNLYPNPSHDFIKIRNKNRTQSHYQIFDFTGRKVLEGNLNNSKYIDIKSLGKGIYIVNFNDKLISRFLKN